MSLVGVSYLPLAMCEYSSLGSAHAWLPPKPRDFGEPAPSLLLRLAALAGEARPRLPDLGLERWARMLCLAPLVVEIRAAVLPYRTFRFSP